LVAELYEDGDKVTYKYDNNGGLLMQMTVGEHVLAFAYDASGTPMTVTLDGVTYYYLTNIQGERLLCKQELAKALGITRPTLDRWLKSKWLKDCRDHSRTEDNIYYYSADAIKSALEEYIVRKG
jgi:hypothetical protein